ncbi:MAG: C4-dicarboxylate ABC transporter permease [Mameliella sp.]|nr:C4-dicarboxylate ABC transporter permease [Mameliella sp.]|tara:strand:- start:2175 stop:4298 length:2124 start_codon:yes stop_codon:yes gene_type:complete
MKKPDTSPDGTLSQADVDMMEFESPMRQLPPFATNLLFFAAAAYAIFHIIILNFLHMDAWVFRTLHVNLGAAIGFLIYAGWKGQRRDRIHPMDFALALAILSTAAYIMSEHETLVMRTGVITTPLDFLFGAIGTVLTIEFARRTSGMVLPIMALIFVAYVFVGPWMPGILHHQGFDTGDFFSFVYSQEGVFGITTAASSRYILLFVAFAVFLQASGAGAYFMDLAFGAFGWARGGPGKVSVVSGILFGTVSGSSVANVVASGTFTIPMMRRVGYNRETAGAIEATSSTGGQLTPPIMGAGAFIMAEITGIPYTEIIAAAILPCLLFYIAVYAHVDIDAIKNNIRGLPRSELPKLRKLSRDIFLLLPLFSLLYLLISGYSIIASGTWGMVCAVVVMLRSHLKVNSLVLSIPLAAFVLLPLLGFKVNTTGIIGVTLGLFSVAIAGYAASGVRGVSTGLKETAKTCYQALGQATHASLQIVAVCACAGIIVGVLGLTGLGGRFSSLILAIAGDSHFVALLFAMMISIILGMGMPTTAAYAIAASVVAPGLQQLGVPALSAHMFVFYYAVISAITPPVAIAAFAASALSGGQPWATSLKAVRFGVAAFIVPFLFYYYPQILLEGETVNIIRVFATSALGILVLAFASEGWLFGKIGTALRVVLVVIAFVMIFGGHVTDIIGFGLAGLLIIWRFANRQVPQEHAQKNGGLIG